MCVGLLLTLANLKWPGDGIYIGHQVERAIGNRYPTFCVVSDRPTVGHRIIRTLCALR